MPTYKNNTSGPLTPPGYDTLQPGQEFSPIKYIFPPIAGLDLIGQGPAPWVTLHDEAPPISLTGLAKYRKIEIVNLSGAIVSCIANQDGSQILPIINNSGREITQDREVETIDLSGSGTEPVYVIGWL